MRCASKASAWRCSPTPPVERNRMAHAFDVNVRWKEGFHGEAHPGGVAGALAWSVPREFGGPGGAWTPEHFLAAAVGSCVQATFLTMAQMSKLQVSGYD